jgi:hypothetical protein
MCQKANQFLLREYKYIAARKGALVDAKQHYDSQASSIFIYSSAQTACVILRLVQEEFLAHR